MMIYHSNAQGAVKNEAAVRIEDIFNDVREEIDRVETILVESLNSDVLLIPKVGQYVFQSGGKRMRPLLAILSSRICSYEGDTHLTMAAVIELIHTATLLHDDVVDHADLRRGARSVNNLWSSETSILVGDFLFTQAFCMMVESKDLEVLDLLSRTCRELAEGEILELSKSGDPAITEEDYLNIVKNKTAVLIAAAGCLGAILSKRMEVKGNLVDYGLSLGMAFQLIDDLLDFAADEKELGKTIGKDLFEGKVTLPIIRTLEKSSDEEREKLSSIIQTRSQQEQDLQIIIEAVHNSDSLEYTQWIAEQYVRKAKESLGVFPDGRYKTALLEVADFVAARRS